MNKSAVLIALFLVNVSFGLAQQLYTLEDIIERAQLQSPSAKQAETRKENRYWQYRTYKANYNPQLRLSGDSPGYNLDFFGNRQDDNTIVFQKREQSFTQLNLGIEQPVAFTGGTVSINSNSSRFDDITRSSTSWNSTLVNIQVDQPLFGFNQLKWDKRTEPLRYEESRRSYVEEMEFVSRRSVEYFFDYLDAQVNLQIAQFNLANNDTIYNIEKGRYNIGTTSEDKLLQVELQLLRSKQDVAQAQLDLQTSQLALRTFTGLGSEMDFELTLPEEIPSFTVTVASALLYAQSNRADFIAFERRRLEAQRQVEEAKRQRYQTNLRASFGLNSIGSTIDESYLDPNNQQRLNLSLDIPIIDWGRNKAQTQTALANKKLTDYVIDQEEQNFEQEIMTQVRQLDVLRLQIEISKKTDEVAQKRYDVAQNRYLIGKIDITNLNIALTEKDNAKRSYLSALRNFWIAYFDLRRLTLYDFANNNLLYTVDN